MATMVRRMNLEQLTEESQLVVHGQIVRSWSAWDEGHHFIWTHHEMKVVDALKGTADPAIRFSEPGGTVDGMSMIVAGAPRYMPGEDVVVFLYRTPIGYLRTTGWGQGKYNIVEHRVHTNLRSIELVNPIRAMAHSAETALETMEGMSVADFKSAVRRKIQYSGGREVQQ